MTRHRAPACRHALRFLCDNLGVEIDSPRCRAVRAHLETCTNCSAYLQSLRRTVAAYRALPVAPPPRGLRRALLASLPGRRRTRRR